MSEPGLAKESEIAEEMKQGYRDSGNARFVVIEDETTCTGLPYQWSYFTLSYCQCRERIVGWTDDPTPCPNTYPYRMKLETRKFDRRRYKKLTREGWEHYDDLMFRRVLPAEE